MSNGEIVNLADHRKPQPDQPGENRECPNCGGQWFHLITPDGLPGAVVLDASTGSVVGYHGEPRCMECPE